MFHLRRELLRFHRAYLVVAALTLAVVLAMILIDFNTEAEIFEPNQAVDRSPSTPIIIPAGEPLLLGFAGPLTGPLVGLGNGIANAAIIGALRWQELHSNEIHGHRIELVGEDDGGTEADVAVIAANLLIERPRLVAIVGPAFSAAATAAIETYAQAGIVMLSGSASRTDLTETQPDPPFFFRTAFTNAAEGPLQAQILIDRLGTGTAFVIDDAEPFGLDLAQAVTVNLEAASWTVVRQGIPQGTVDFTPLVDAVLATATDAVVYEGFNPDAALLLAQLRDAGYQGLFLGGDGVVSQEAFIDVLGPDAEGALLTGCPQPLSADYLRLWTAGGGGAAPPAIGFLGNTADAAFLLLDAVAAVAQPHDDGSLQIDPLALRDHVAATNTTGWATGEPIAFGPTGDRLGLGPEAGLVACVVRDGAFVEITI